MKISKVDAFSICIILFLFILFLADCDSSRIGIVSQIAKIVNKYSLDYLLALLVVFLGLLICNFKLNLGDAVNYLIPYSLFAIITVVLQLINGFQSYSYRELIASFVPVIVYISFINVYRNGYSFNIDILFYLLIIFFFIYNAGIISLGSIKAVSFINSYSAFESKYAYYGLILELYYIYKKDKPKMIVSFIICTLSMKRVAFVFGLLLLIFHNKIATNKPVKKTFVLWTMILFLGAPLLIQFICNDSFGIWFADVTGISLNTFVSGRISKFNAVFDSGAIKYGWGSSTIYLTNNLWTFARYTDYYKGQWINIHSDIVKIYCECSILSLFVFLRYHLKQVKNNWMCFLLMFYLFTDMMVNHHLGIGKVLLWIIVYIVIHEIKMDCNLGQASTNIPDNVPQQYKGL